MRLLNNLWIRFLQYREKAQKRPNPRGLARRLERRPVT
jgi:hypothetical protein